MKNLKLEDVVRIIGSIQPSGNEEKALPTFKGKRIREKTYYISGLSSDLATNAGEALLPSTVKTVGITNFPSNAQLTKGTYFLCTGVRMLFDTTVTDPKLALWANVAPIAWKNGELILGQENQPTLFEAPVTDVHNFKASTGNDDDFRDTTFLLQPENVISVKALPAGTPVASVVKIEMRGYEIFNS